MSRIRTGQFDKIAGENERNEVRTVAIWNGTHERREVGIYNLVVILQQPHFVKISDTVGFCDKPVIL